MDKNKLLGIALMHGDGIEEIAVVLGKDKSTIYRKLNDDYDAQFTQGEIATLKSRYKLSAKQVDEIFFCGLEVSKSDTENKKVGD